MQGRPVACLRASLACSHPSAPPWPVPPPPIPLLQPMTPLRCSVARRRKDNSSALMLRACSAGDTPASKANDKREGSTPNACEERSTSTLGLSIMARGGSGLCGSACQAPLIKSEAALRLDTSGRGPSCSSRRAGVRTAWLLGGQADMPRLPSGIARGGCAFRDSACPAPLSKSSEAALPLDASGRGPSDSSRCAGVRTARPLGDQADMPRRPSSRRGGEAARPS